MPDHNKPEAIIYCRQASYGAPPNDAPDAQQAACLRYAEERNYEVVAVFRDNGSGLKVVRPSMSRMSNMLHQRATNDIGTIVIVDEIARLARDPVVLGQLVKSFRTYGALVEYAGAKPADDLAARLSSDPIELPFPLKRGFA